MQEQVLNLSNEDSSLVIDIQQMYSQKPPTTYFNQARQSQGSGNTTFDREYVGSPGKSSKGKKRVRISEVDA